MQIGIVYQNSQVWAVFDSGDYAADKCKEMQTKFPWFHWQYAYHTVLQTKVAA